MLLDEARIASRIAHGNVIQILDLGEEHEILYIVMEWIDGDSLSRINRALQKKGQTVPPAIALRILADTCDGLHAAHELREPNGGLLGVVHRDVSPQNILVTTTGTAKLIDFGIAKARDRLAGDTTTGSLKGKLRYIAPEQAKGESVDRRTDVWSVGAVLYHLIAGEAPFDAENDLAMLHMLTTGAAPRPLPAIVPAPVGEVLHRALSHDPSARFSTAMEMRQAIERAVMLTGLSATTNDVAAFLAEHLGEQAAARRRVVDAAIARASATRASQAGLPKWDADTEPAAMLPPATVDVATTSTTPIQAAAFAPAPVLEPTPVSAAGSELSANGSFGLASIPARPPPRRWIALVGALALVGIAVVTFLVAFRGHAGRRGETAATAPAALPAPIPSAAVTPGESASVAAAPELAEVPPASSSPSPRRPSRPRAAPTALAVPSTRPAPTTSAKHRRVDDGF
jgi:serine/threonine-protein kinase